MAAPAKRSDRTVIDRARLPMTGAKHGEWVVVGMLFVLLAFFGARLYQQAAGYLYGSIDHFQDIVRARLWSLSWLAVTAAVLFFVRKTRIAPLWAVFSVSAYFLVLYGILFRATEYGMNSHWGDNGNRLAEVCKMMAYGSFFQDWYLKDLPSFYPPGWFAITAVYAKLIGIEAYQTVKWGYYLIFLIYPWLLFFSWRRLVSPRLSAAIVVVTIFFAYKYMDSMFYESITAGLFIPFWLFYVERGLAPTSHPLALKDYIWGALVGGAIFLTYYYWFFVGLVATPIILIARYVQTRSLRFVWRDVRHKLIIAAGVALVASIYWVPLLRTIYRYGSESAQHAWFANRHMDLMTQWPQPTLETFLVFAGVFAAFYYWEKYGRGSILFLYLGGFLVIVIDRLYNLNYQTIQSRKVLEYVHLFGMTPLAIGAIEFWDRWKDSPALRAGVIGVTCLAAVVVANDHPNMEDAPYRNAINQRVPQADLRAFQSIDVNGAVVLTDQYIQCVYLPYYLFIPLNNMTSHTAGRYSQREFFIKTAATIAEPDLLAYVLKHNRFSPVDYVYLPNDSVTGTPYLTLYQAAYNVPAQPVTYVFSCRLSGQPVSFIQRSDQGLYEVNAAPRSDAMDRIIDEKYHDILWCLEPTAR